MGCLHIFDVKYQEEESDYMEIGIKKMDTNVRCPFVCMRVCANGAIPYSTCRGLC